MIRAQNYRHSLDSYSSVKLSSVSAEPAPRSRTKKHHGLKIELEVIVGSLVDQSTVRYFVLSKDITGSEYDPDKVVLELLESPENGIPMIARSNSIVHSTLWRFVSHQTIVLTYFVYSDVPMFRKHGGKLLSLLDFTSSGTNDSCNSKRKQDDETYIVTNGMKHISHLVNKRSSRTLSKLTPETIRNFQHIETLLAGKLCLVGRAVT